MLLTPSHKRPKHRIKGLQIYTLGYAQNSILNTKAIPESITAEFFEHITRSE